MQLNLFSNDIGQRKERTTLTDCWYDKHLAARGCFTTAEAKLMRVGELLVYMEPGGSKAVVEFQSTGTNQGSPVVRVKKANGRCSDVYYSDLQRVQGGASSSIPCEMSRHSLHKSNV